VHNTPFTDVNDTEHEVQEMGYRAFDTAGRMIALLDAFLAATTIDTAAVRRNHDQTLATVPYAVFAGAFAAVVDRSPAMGEAEFRRIGTPDHFIAVRTLYGGPAPAPMDRSLAGYRNQLEMNRARLADLRRRIDTAATVLADCVAAWQTPASPARKQNR
jgi:argininosuccinate lyase